MQEPINLRAFLVRFMGQTSTKPSQCVIEDLHRAEVWRSRDKGAWRYRVTLSKGMNYSHCSDQAIDYLRERGIEILHTANHPQGTLLLSGNFQKELKD